MSEREIRIEKAQRLREQGIDPYPARFQPERTHTIPNAMENFETLAEQKTTVTLTGRIISRRDMGKAVFMHIEDGYSKAQVYARRDDIGEEQFSLLKLLDLGDFVAVSGYLFTTKTGEKSLHAHSISLLAKSLHQLPAKHEGLKDAELRQRKRYLDLIANRDEVMDVFIARTHIISAVREFLDSLNYLEVETPILQPLYGGATAKPFSTHHNALDRDLFLRIAPELYLKRLLVGGFERVYEVARNFRNEGIDRSHNPEFTMLEFYEAYADYTVMMQRVEDLVTFAAQKALGKLQFEWGSVTIDLAKPWRRITLRDAILHYVGIDYDAYPDRESLLNVITKKKIHVDPNRGRGRLIDELKDEMFRAGGDELLQPIILYDFPVDLSPLTKKKPGVPGTVERFQAHLAGMQLATSFSELNDPQDQFDRFEDQAAQRALGDDESQNMDSDYIEALEVGMPPAGGVGIGLDRLVMALTNQQNIREVILFPTMRTLEQQENI